MLRLTEKLFLWPNNIKGAEFEHGVFSIKVDGQMGTETHTIAIDDLTPEGREFFGLWEEEEEEEEEELDPVNAAIREIFKFAVDTLSSCPGVALQLKGDDETIKMLAYAPNGENISIVISEKPR